MHTIELAGRVKKTIKLNGLYYHCKDVNLDKEFLFEFGKVLLNEIQDDLFKLSAPGTRAFDDEIISKVIIDSEKYKINLKRDTYGK